MKEYYNPAFEKAMMDYLFLKNRGYVEKPACKIVGDRYALSGIQRQILFRGIMSDSQCHRRQGKLLETIEACVLHVDGYNVLFSLMNYLLGKAVFIALDGFMRDIGGSYGKIQSQTAFHKTQELFLQFVSTLNQIQLRIYLDIPVSGSKNHSEQLKEKMQQMGVSGDIILVESVDEVLISLTGEKNIIASSDTPVIDAAQCHFYDAARHSLENRLGIEIYSISRYLADKSTGQ